MALTPLYTIAAHPLLGGKYNELDPTEQVANHLLAEMLLDLRPPAYTADKAEELGYAVVLQINFQLEKGTAQDITKSVSNAHPGNVTQFRDRYVAPGAWAIVSRVTGVVSVGFHAPGFGT